MASNDVFIGSLVSVSIASIAAFSSIQSRLAAHKQQVEDVKARVVRIEQDQVANERENSGLVQRVATTETKVDLILAGMKDIVHKLDLIFYGTKRRAEDTEAHD